MKKDLVFVIFGSTGDLTARKLLPAMTKLFRSKSISQNMRIIALGRRDYQQDTYLDYMQSLTDDKLNRTFLRKHLEYVQMQITDKKDYQMLSDTLKKYGHAETKYVFYLAIGPELLPIVAKNLSETAIVLKGNLNQVMVFEKPFGHDLLSARTINKMLFDYFDESQIYRIDHYLGKEMIQNLMTVRFANRIFEDVWTNETIKSVKIMAKEKEGILNRAGYYDTAGALKDMIQSHLLQMLCLIAMDAPKSYTSEDIKNEKVAVLKQLRFDRNSLVFGQYQGYLDEANIPSDSQTETFVYLKAFVDSPRFKGVPFHLITGKKLNKKESLIEITFKPTQEQEKWKLPLDCNKLLIRIAPKDGVDLLINSKEPGLKENMSTVKLSYHTASSVGGNIPEAYEKLLLDVTEGHKTLFTRWDEIEFAWKFVDEIKKNQGKPFIYQNYLELKEMMKLKDSR